MSRQMQGMELKMPGTNYFMLRRALPIAPLAVVDGANAACAQASPIGTSPAPAVTEMPHLPQ